MGGPGHALHHHGRSPVHRLPAHVKIVATLVFAVAVVATPREAVWAFGLHLLVLVAVAVTSRVPARHLARRLVVEVPFVLLAVTMPFIATGPRTTVGPLTVSEAGLWAGWALLAKGSLGALAAVLLGATTDPSDLVAGLGRLRLPRQLVLILSFMLRYVEVVSGELRRMRVARESRGFAGRGLRSWPVLASGAGALFVRSYERGERVHLAMLSRGFQGRVDLDDGASTSALVWSRGLAPPVVAALVALTAWVVVGGAS